MLKLISNEMSLLIKMRMRGMLGRLALSGDYSNPKEVGRAGLHDSDKNEELASELNNDCFSETIAVFVVAICRTKTK